jgi:Zn-dependent protease with chaperone function
VRPVIKKHFIFILVLSLVFSCSFNAAYAGAENTDLEEEIQLGQRVARSIENHWERISEPGSLAKLKMIMNNIAPYLSRPLPYEVRMIREPSMNAFSLPGGIIYLTSGMYNSARSDDELAAVISHELVHADKKHVMKQVARNQKISLVALAVAIASKGEAVPVLLSNVAQLAITNSYSKDLEREADILGVENLKKAGFEPSGMVTLLEALAEDKMKHPWVDPGIYMDHPYVEDRIEYIISHIRQENWDLERKKALNVLNPTITQGEDGLRVLFLDSQEICSAPSGPLTEEVLDKAASQLRSSLQLESLPYEVKVMDATNGNGQELYVGNTLILAEPLPEDFTPLTRTRDNIVKALLAAKKLHPVTDFLK